MANQYKWSINALEYKPVEGDLADVVVTCHWRYGVSNGDDATAADYIYTDIFGAQSFQIPTDAANFIPFADLTEVDVISWLEDALDVVSMREQLDARLDNIINPPVKIKHNPFAPEPVIEQPVVEAAPAQKEVIADPIV